MESGGGLASREEDDLAQSKPPTNMATLKIHQPQYD